VSWQGVADRLIAEYHWHETVRQPTWVELFGQPGGLVGNRDLVPEELAGQDVGLRLALPALGAALRRTGFDQTTEQTIIYTLAGPGLSEPLNIGRSRTRGIECEAVVERGPLALDLALTWQEARDGGGVDPTYEGKGLPFLSDRTASADLQWQLGDWRPGIGYLYESENFRDRYNQPIHRAPARHLVNVALARRWRDGPAGAGHELVVTAEVLNLTDNDVYDMEGYPLPGRSARLSLHWQ